MTLPRTAVVVRMDARQERRRPLLLVLLVVVPLVFISWNLSLATDEPRPITLPGPEPAVVTALDLTATQGVSMTVGLLAALCGLFMMQAALEADGRLVVAGFRPLEVVAARLAVLAGGVVLVLAASVAVTAVEFRPRSWLVFCVGALLAGGIYATIGALAAAVLDRLGAVYFVFFLPLLDLGVIQNPEFWTGQPDPWTALLPAHGAVRVLVDGAFSPGFDATGDLVAALAWLTATTTATVVVLGRSFTGKP
jgi:hypothetical protein